MVRFLFAVAEIIKRICRPSHLHEVGKRCAGPSR